MCGSIKRKRRSVRAFEYFMNACTERRDHNARARVLCSWISTAAICCNNAALVLDRARNE
jgi:hypothetical protein